MAVPNRVVQAPHVNGSWAKPLDQHPPVPVTGGCYIGRCGSSRSRHRPGSRPAMDTPATSREPARAGPNPTRTVFNRTVSSALHYPRPGQDNRAEIRCPHHHH